MPSNGCGTGLAGQGLAGHGFVTIDGLDMSPEMMQVAARRGVYRNFIAADLNLALDMASETYDGASCSGTFTHGHVAANCLDELSAFSSPARRLRSPSSSKSGSRWASRTSQRR